MRLSLLVLLLVLFARASPRVQKRKPPQSDARPSRSGPEFDCSHGWLAPDAKGTPVPGRDGWAKRVKHTDWWAVDEPDAVAGRLVPAGR